MAKREEHCAGAQLNPNGRCIAYCHYTQGSDEIDCIGNTGKTIEPNRENDYDDTRRSIWRN